VTAMQRQVGESGAFHGYGFVPLDCSFAAPESQLVAAIVVRVSRVPLVHFQVVLWRAASSSSSCQRSWFTTGFFSVVIQFRRFQA